MGLAVALLVGLSSLVALVFFRSAFSGLIAVSPIAFQVAGLEVRWYGLFAALGLLIGIPWALHRARQLDLGPPATVEQSFWWSVFGGLVGARLVYVAQNLVIYLQHPLQFLAIADGGLSIHGMLLGGLLAGAIAARLARINFRRLADAATPSMLLGMIIGRLGNFTNGELFGYPTSLPWKMFIDPIHRPEIYATQTFFHPIFLYDALLNGLLLLFILRTEQSCRFKGELLGRFLLGVSATRFVVEFWRINDPPSLGVLSSAQIVSLILGLVSLVFLLVGRRRALVVDRS